MKNMEEEYKCGKCDIVMVYSPDWFDFVCISCGAVSVIGSDLMRKFRESSPYSKEG